MGAHDTQAGERDKGQVGEGGEVVGVVVMVLEGVVEGDVGLAFEVSGCWGV